MSRRLAEVARKVGVSEATVSRVLNGKPGVSESTREAVLTALDVLGYERPTKLRGERARLVGLVLPELQNPIFPAFAEVVGGALAQQGFTPVLCTQTAGGVSEADYVELLLGQQVSGIVFAGGHYAQRDATHGHYERLTGRNLPVVLINASIEELPFPRVSCDDEVAIEQAIGHLASLGHTTIGLVLGPGRPRAVRAQAAARRRRSRGAWASSSADRQVVRSAYSLESGQAAGNRLLREGVTGHRVRERPAGARRRSGRRAGPACACPDDISVVGYDDSAFMSCTEPPLTTVRQPIEPMGRAAIDLLVSQIHGAAVPQDELLFEPELVVRGSTGPAPDAAGRRLAD